jgi:C-terminal processing protease CtpA/Prc
VWGLAKHFHPKVTKKKVDWDKVLIEQYKGFKDQNDFETYNLKIGTLLNTLQAGKKTVKVTPKLFQHIIEDNLSALENFDFLLDTNKYDNRISFSWINDAVFSQETKFKLCEILVNYKPYSSKFLKGKVRVKHPENNFEELDSITEPYRMLGLFRYWNTIHYYFPYKYLSDNNWDKVLIEAIPKFSKAERYTAYTIQLMKLSSKINDSHGYYRYMNIKYLQQPEKTMEVQKIKPGYIPYHFKLFDSTVVVSKVLMDSCVLNVGDTVLEINKFNLHQYWSRYGRYNSHSSKQSKIYKFEMSLSKFYSSEFNIEIRSGKDTVKFVENKAIDKVQHIESYYRKPPYSYSINEQIGYVDLTQIKFGKLEKTLKNFKNKQAVIFDMRGYPETLAWLALPHLLSKKGKKVATFSAPYKKCPGTYVNHNKGESYRFWFVKPFLFLRNQFKADVVVLINAEAISQSETACMMFKAYCNELTFVGAPTAGANGDISALNVPGGMSFNFSSLDWHFPNGNQLQRIGIIPDIYVKETLAGMKLGKDEILEAAIEYLKEGK